MQKNWKDLVELSLKYRDEQIQFWLNESLFTFNWWLLLVTSLVVTIVWIIVLDRKRMLEIIAFGLMVLLTALSLDYTGDFLGLWSYKYSLLPMPVMIEIHTFQTPVIYMIIYQYFSKWKSFLIAITIASLIFAFVLEPILTWLDIYELYHWKYIYSFLPYIFIGVAFKYVISKLKNNG